MKVVYHPTGDQKRKLMTKASCQFGRAGSQSPFRRPNPETIQSNPEAQNENQESYNKPTCQYRQIVYNFLSFLHFFVKCVIFAETE